SFSLPDFSWIAWTWPTATFFVVIALLLIGMGVWEYSAPGGNPRIGILRFETTRGDRLFTMLDSLDQPEQAQTYPP
ncbi:DUF2160 domain-containing protein, partial [Rhizobium ruizarguesonis]